MLNRFLVDAYRPYFLIYYGSLGLLFAVFRPFILRVVIDICYFPNHFISLCCFPFILFLLMVLIECCM